VSGGVPDRRACVARDLGDPLAQYRERFLLPDDIVYLDGNSLGALPAAAAQRVDDVTREEWGRGLIRSWNDAHWISAPQRTGDKLARLIGASPGEVVVADSTSVNLFKLLVSALRERPGRRVVVTQADNFPTDLYIAGGVAELLGVDIRAVDAGDVEDALDGDVAVVYLTHVHFTSGVVHDVARITRAAHECGALAMWDLSHSTPVVAVELDEWDIDLAAGCGYKHLNGGPGAPAYLFVARRLQDSLGTALPGWMGHADPFAFSPEYTPASGIARHLSGTPAILGLAALEAAVDLWLEADLVDARDKATALGDLFIDMVTERCAGHGLEVMSPRHGPRGAHVSLRHAEGYRIMQALIARGVIGDVRPPGLMRFGFAPLYTRYVDVHDAVETLADVLETHAWDREDYAVRAVVT
jgi:kynureninase